MKNNVHTYVFRSLIIIGLLAFGTDAMADLSENDILESTIRDYRQSFAFVQFRLTNLLVATFWLLAIAEFTWILCKLAVGDGDIQKAMVEILTRIMFIGFFWFLFTRGTSTISLIVDSFIQLAASSTASTTVPSSAAGINPDDIIDVGFEIMALIWDKMSITSPIDSAAFLIAGLITLIALIMVAAYLAVAILEFYVVGYSAFFLLALGGASWTSGYAVSYLKYAFSVGMKLFVMLVLTAVSTSLIKSYLVNINIDHISQVWPLLAYSLFFMILAMTAPNAIVGVMQGASTATGAHVAQAASGLKSAATGGGGGLMSALKGAAGGALAGAAAAKAGAAAPGSTPLGAAKALGQAAAGVAKDSLQGRSAGGSLFPGSGTIGGRMAAKMDQKSTSSSKKS